MKLSQLQSIRSKLSNELKDLHPWKYELKRNIKDFYEDSIPNTENGKYNFSLLNDSRDCLRRVNKDIELLNIQVMLVKKQMRDMIDEASGSKYKIIDLVTTKDEIEFEKKWDGYHKIRKVNSDNRGYYICLDLDGTYYLHSNGKIHDGVLFRKGNRIYRNKKSIAFWPTKEEAQAYFDQWLLKRNS